MVNNARIAELIRDDKAEDVHEAIAEGAFFNMQTFSQSLIELVLKNEIDREVAANASSNRHDFLVALERAEKQQTAEVRAAEQAATEAAEQEAQAAVEESMPGLRVAHAPTER
jgi:Tfp pilus assembly ATPase PilU